jgi:hypothetical protein
MEGMMVWLSIYDSGSQRATLLADDNEMAQRSDSRKKAWWMGEFQIAPWSSWAEAWDCVLL